MLFVSRKRDTWRLMRRCLWLIMTNKLKPIDINQHIALSMIEGFRKCFGQRD